MKTVLGVDGHGIGGIGADTGIGGVGVWVMVIIMTPVTIIWTMMWLVHDMGWLI